MEMIRIGKWIFCAILLTTFFAHGAKAATHAAASCSASDVQAAINLASNGDTVQVPGGVATWGTTVTISSSQQITLDGGGCTVTWGGSGGLSVTAGTTNSTRVTNFKMNGSFTNGDCPISITTSTSPLSMTFRFDHNTLDGGNPGAPGTFLCSHQNGPGLFDHNTFTTHNGADEMLHLLGNGASDASGWTDVVTPGGPNMTFIEYNTFICTSATIASAWESYYGARLVGRDNTFTNSQIDAHGGGGIGTRWWEVYKNIFTGGGNICLRAGSGVVFSNTPGGSIRMIQESGTYPANYQIGRGQNEVLFPAYEWGDTGWSLLLNTTEGCAAGSANMVQLNRDVYQPTTGTFASIPGSCSQNQGYFATDKNTLYKCSSAGTWNAYYTPYTDPHPLETGAGATSPPAPTNLSAVVQ